MTDFAPFPPAAPHHPDAPHHPAAPPLPQQPGPQQLRPQQPGPRQPGRQQPGPQQPGPQQPGPQQPGPQQLRPQQPGPRQPGRQQPTPPAWPTAPIAEQPRLNVPALLSVVLLVVCAPASIVLGLVGRWQATRRAERGRGLATVGIVVGAALTLIGVAVTTLVLASGAVQVQAYDGPRQPGAVVASAIVDSAQGRVQDVTCPLDLPGRVGATIDCTGVIDGRPGTLRATATEVRGQEIGFDWKQTS